MKNSLPSLAICVCVACAGDLRGQPRPLDDSAAPPAARPREVQSTLLDRERRKEPTDESAAATDQDAAALMDDTIAATRSRSSISAKIRQRVDILDQHLVGTGAYLQQGRGEEQQVRLELKIGVKDQTTSLQQVCDGRFLWIHQDLLDKTSLTRIDVVRVRETLEQHHEARASMQQSNIALCGMSKLLESLNAAFAFRIVKQDRLDGVPVWVVRGTWRPEALAKTFPNPKAAAATGQGSDAAPPKPKLPAHAPEVVVLMVGRDDLFPYRIEYRRRVESDGKTPTRTDITQPILVMEWFEVALDTPLDPRQFVYKPGDLDYSDGTDKLLESLGITDPAKK